MKTFMEEYGLASVMAACVMFLVVMASPVGGAINGNLKSTATNMGDTGTNVQANAAKSIKSLAGEEEEVPDTIFVGYNSQNHCLVFSHDENSPKYSACDTKYGDCKDSMNSGYKSGNPRPYLAVRSSIKKINIENTIAPQNINNLFFALTNVEEVENLTNINVKKCTEFAHVFEGLSKNAVKHPRLDLTGWKTNNVTSMQYMFCETRASSVEFSGWDTSNVTDMSYMFWDFDIDNNTIDLSDFNSKNLHTITEMFAYSNVTSLIFTNKFSQSNSKVLGQFSYEDSNRQVYMNSGIANNSSMQPFSSYNSTTNGQNVGNPWKYLSIYY